MTILSRSTVKKQPTYPESHGVGTLYFSQHPEPEMQQRPQWVVWRYESIGGQTKKPPFHPLTGRKTNVTLKTGRWGTYNEAISAYQSGEYDGIGFIFTTHDPYTGIDLDHCIDLTTGKISATWASKILAAIPSYSEYSPSGSGLHIITRATLPSRGLKEGNIEVYSSGTYFTWTNNHLPDTPDTIQEQQDRVNLLHEWLLYKRTYRQVRENTWGGDHSTPGSPPVISWQSGDQHVSPEEQQARERADNWILDKARAARNGATFIQLYDSVIPDADGGQHLGDIQLCVQLLYWCRDDSGKPDVAWADRLFRKSARMRPKWDRKLGAYTYGQTTLWKAYLDVQQRFGHYWQKKKGEKR